MIISIIVAMAENRVMGRNGAIPWDLPADLRRFRELTMGRPVIMGRKTWESIGQPLPGRRNIVLSRRPDFRAEGCIVARSLEEALGMCAADDEAFICGGEELYRLALPLADTIYLTLVHQVCDGDVFFPPIPVDFAVTERSAPEEGGGCTFIIYRRMAL
jgi:dihydrofolate reductase